MIRLYILVFITFLFFWNYSFFYGSSCHNSYIDAFLDILLANEYVVDRLGQEEVCFLGPDEFTGKLMDWAAVHAKVNACQ